MFIQVVWNTEHLSRKHENSTSSFKFHELFFWHFILWRNSLNFFQLLSLPKCYANLHECTSKQTHGNPDPENPLNKFTQRSMKQQLNMKTSMKHPYETSITQFSKHPMWLTSTQSKHPNIRSVRHGGLLLCPQRPRARPRALRRRPRRIDLGRFSENFWEKYGQNMVENGKKNINWSMKFNDNQWI